MESSQSLKVLGRVPLPFVRLAANRMLRRVLEGHPDLFDRLGSHAVGLFLFEPTDLPYAFTVRPSHRTVEVRARGRVLRSTVKISGPLLLMLALAEGRVDGDAEFFARQIRIEGDMEAALALRNALDDSAIDFVRELAPRRGPARRPIELILGAVRNRFLLGARRWS